MSDAILTPAEVATRLRLDEKKIVRGSLRRELPWVKFGQSLRMKSSDLDAFIEDIEPENYIQSTKRDGNSTPLKKLDTSLDQLPYLTVGEAAAYTRRSSGTIYAWIGEGWTEGVHFVRPRTKSRRSRPLIVRKELDLWLRGSRPIRPEPPPRRGAAINPALLRR